VHLFIYISFPYIYIVFLSSLSNFNPKSKLGLIHIPSHSFVSTIIVIVIGMHKKTKISNMMHIFLSFILINHPLLYMCSFYDANKAYKMEKISLLFFVYNFEYYSLGEEEASLLMAACRCRYDGVCLIPRWRSSKGRCGPSRPHSTTTFVVFFCHDDTVGRGKQMNQIHISSCV
jgi:hypothetical protein